LLERCPRIRRLDLAGGFDYSGPPSEESRAYIADALDAMLRARRPA
jgi:hypothetical protein